ncbi:MAG: MacS family sensor histidine kinase [Micromonosporaceae bacterium]
MAFEVPFWRALAVFRLAALAYSGTVTAINLRGYAHPVVGGAVLAVMVAWTLAASYGYAEPARRRWPLLTADLLVSGGCLLATGWVVRPGGIAFYESTLPGIWVGAPVLAWAISGGRRRGTVAALLLGAADISIRGGLDPRNLSGTALMLLAGLVVGHVGRLAFDAEERLQQATQREAAIRERERLARQIHDSVLQVLALVQRRGAELGSDAEELGRLAGEQENALRSLVSTGEFAAPASGLSDLRTALGRYACPTVTLVTPADPVPLPARTTGEVAAAVGSALDNVARHCPAGTRAWVVLEAEPGEVLVTVRDDGAGIPEGRLPEAAAAGRLGVAQSIRGRIADLGGTVAITSAPDAGTEVELRLPVLATPDASPHRRDTGA